MMEYLTILVYITIWGFLYQFLIIPRTAEKAFETWQSRLEEDDKLLVEICDPLLVEIESMLETRFQSFFGSIGKLGQQAQQLNPKNNMKKAIKSGDFYSILAEYVAGKAGLGPLQNLIGGKVGKEEDKNEGNHGPL